MEAQLPVRNIANTQAAVSGMIAQGNNIARDIQAYDAHQQQLTTELPLCANCNNVAQIQQQLATITQQRIDEMAMMSAQ